MQRHTDDMRQFDHDLQAGIADARLHFGDVRLSQPGPPVHIGLAQTGGDSRLAEVFGEQPPFGRDGFVIRRITGGWRFTGFPGHARRPFFDTVRRAPQYYECNRCGFEHRVRPSRKTGLFGSVAHERCRFRDGDSGLWRQSNGLRTAFERTAANRSCRKQTKQSAGRALTIMDLVKCGWVVADHTRAFGGFPGARPTPATHCSVYEYRHWTGDSQMLWITPDVGVRLAIAVTIWLLRRSFYEEHRL